jgi:hypothetical protein
MIMSEIEKQIMEEVLMEALQSFKGLPNTPKTRKDALDYLLSGKNNSDTEKVVLH